MRRPATHAAARPFRVNHTAAAAHRQHLPTPFLGCAICARRASTSPTLLRSSAPQPA